MEGGKETGQPRLKSSHEYLEFYQYFTESEDKPPDGENMPVKSFYICRLIIEKKKKKTASDMRSPRAKVSTPAIDL